MPVVVGLFLASVFFWADHLYTGQYVILMGEFCSDTNFHMRSHCPGTCAAGAAAGAKASISRAFERVPSGGGKWGRGACWLRTGSRNQHRS